MGGADIPKKTTFCPPEQEAQGEGARGHTALPPAHPWPNCAHRTHMKKMHHSQGTTYICPMPKRTTSTPLDPVVRPTDLVKGSPRAYNPAASMHAAKLCGLGPCTRIYGRTTIEQLYQIEDVTALGHETPRRGGADTVHQDPSSG